MTRTRDWLKFSFLVAVTIVLAVAFAGAVNFPRIGEAQQRRPVVINTTPPASIPAAQPAADLGEAFAAVVEAVRPAVVFIRAESDSPRSTPGRNNRFDDFFRNQPRQPRSGTGSGFVISEDGYIITNNHVVEGADRITVRMLDRRVFDATLVGRDPNTDIAIIKIDATGLVAASLGNSDEVRIGEWALAIGNPLGEAFSFTVTAGIVSAKGRVLNGLQTEQTYRIQDFIQTDAAINPGNSGGPLVNIRGQVIGVNSAIASQSGLNIGYGFAVPINLARTVGEQLIATGRVTRAILGVSIQDATAYDAEYVGLDSIYGVRIDSYSRENSPAERAGLRLGDVIIELDGEPVSYTGQLQQVVGFRKPGDRVDVTVARPGGERRTHTVTLIEAEPDQQLATHVEQPVEEGRSGFDDKLGVTLEEVTANRLAREGLPRRYAGLRIRRIDPQGPARNYLLPGEIITHVEGERVRTEQDLIAALEDVKPGQIISVRTALLGTRPVRTRVVRFRAGSN
ncbi:MAG: trypsin-like peptidase domain-containing protein [Gemmatimonadetes bacterium]|nr:trypsin-like peptidase domain-containing protein [Gemmatimonadota bacterium]